MKSGRRNRSIKCLFNPSNETRIARAVFIMCLIQMAAMGAGSFAYGQDTDQTPNDLELASQLNVELTEAGVAEFLDRLLAEKDGLSTEEIDALVKQLGGDTFKDRESAMHRLAGLPDPPVEKLRAATKDPDFELATRAQAALDLIAKRQDPRAAVFRLIQRKEIKTNPEQLQDVIAITKDEKTFSAALETFAAVVGENEKYLQLLRKNLEDDRPRVVASAVRLLPKIQSDKQKLVKELRRWLNDENVPIRMAASRALIECGEKLEYESFANLLDDVSLLTVIRNEEKNFREQNKDNRQNREAMAKYQAILKTYAKVVIKTGNAEQKKKRASGDDRWIKQGLDTSMHPELLMYRIKWLNGNWSGWFVPGFNDREKGKGRDIRYWACFNDHEHETIIATKKEMHREIQDLP